MIRLGIFLRILTEQVTSLIKTGERTTTIRHGLIITDLVSTIQQGMKFIHISYVKFLVGSFNLFLTGHFVEVPFPLRLKGKFSLLSKSLEGVVDNIRTNIHAYIKFLQRLQIQVQVKHTNKLYKKKLSKF